MEITAALKNARRKLETGDYERIPYHVRQARRLANSGGVGEWPQQKAFDVPALKEDWRDNPPE